MLEELQKLLSRTDLSLAEIANGTGLSVSLLRAIKNGDRPNPTINTYQTLKDYLLRAKAQAKAA